MVFTLISVITRRNLSSLSIKTLKYKDVLLHNRATVRFHPVTCFSTSERKWSESKPPAGSNIITSTLSKTLSGKPDFNEVTKLAKIVTEQAQFTKFREAPVPAQILGFGGLAPFVGVPLLILINASALPGLVFAELAYGATILSFLGGANWIEAINKGDITLNKLGWTVTPQVLGWTALLLPTPLGLILTTVGLSASLAHDVLLTSYPAWLKSLRYVLTVGAVGSLTLTFLMNIVF